MNSYWKVTNEQGKPIAGFDHCVEAVGIIKNSTVPLGLLINEDLFFDAVNLSFALFREEEEDALFDAIMDYVTAEKEAYRSMFPLAGGVS